jgi:hypothetical protein
MPATSTSAATSPCSKSVSKAKATEVFEKELLQNLQQLQEHGLFFSVTTDPLVSEGKK